MYSGHRTDTPALSPTRIYFQTVPDKAGMHYVLVK